MGALVRTHEATHVAIFRVLPATGRSVAIVE
jgi:hypothetical protein